MNYGFIPSKMDGTENKFKKLEGFKIPEEYSYKKYLPKVFNQGSKPICVPCSLSAYINWSINIETGDNKVDNDINLNEIYDSRTTDDNNGMTFKDGLRFLKHKGVDTLDGVKKIERYSTVGSVITLKQALILNGPCVGALPVYDSQSYYFWDKYPNARLEGGHAISIVGDNKDGFIIRNSWGESYGDNGYSIIPYDEFESFMEIWTIY